MPDLLKYFEVFLVIAFWASVLAMVHSYMLYPLLARLACRWLLPRRAEQSLEPKQPDESMAWPAISVLVPAHNEATVIAAKIENFLAFDYPIDRIELLIFDDGSVDETAVIAEQAIAAASAKSGDGPPMRLIRGETRSGKATAVNALSDEAQHDLWLLTDANVILNRDALKHLAASMIDPQVGAVTGPVVLVGSGESFQEGEVLYYQIERSIQRAESFIASVMGVDGGMYLARGQLLPKLPADTILDDFTVSMAVMRNSARIVYCEEALASECGTVSAGQEYRRRVRIAAGAVQLVGRGWLPKVSQPMLWFLFLSHKLIRWVSPLLLLIGVLSAFAIAFLADSAASVFYWWALICGVFVCLLAALIAFAPIGKRSIAGPVIRYFVLSQVAISVGLVKGIFHLQPPQWEKADRTVDGG